MAHLSHYGAWFGHREARKRTRDRGSAPRGADPRAGSRPRHGAGGRAGSGVSPTETSIEPILGWRIWHVDREPGGPRLRSWAHSVPWPAGERIEAQCRSILSLALPSWSHGAPRKGHRCGIYAL